MISGYPKAVVGIGTGLILASAIGIGFASLSSRLAMQVQRQFSDGEKRGRKLAESLAAGPILHGT